MENKKVNKITIMVGLLLSGFAIMFSETALNIALVPLMKSFQVNETTIQWVSTGYMMVAGIVLPISSMLIKNFTTRQIVIFAQVDFILGTVIAALSSSFYMLLFGRLIQGIAGGLILPVVFNTIMALYPPEKRGGVMGMTGLVVMFAPVISPTVAGIILNSLSWQWIFWAVLLLMTSALIVTLFNLRNVTEVMKTKLDIYSVIFSTLGFGGVVFGTSMGSDKGWTSASCILGFIIGLISLIVFCYRQLKIDNPIWQLKAFYYKEFTLGTILVVVIFGVTMCANILLPMYYQNGKQISVATAGLLILPSGVINGIMSAVSGKLFDSYGAKNIVRIGSFITLISTGLLCMINASTATILVVIFSSILMFGCPLALSPAQTYGLNSLPSELSADGSSIMNTLQQIVAALCTALATNFLKIGQNSYYLLGGNNSSEAVSKGIRYGFIYALFLCVVMVITSMQVKSDNKIIDNV
ncbi:multidrug efflux MFS transporter [Clostridium sp. P21]|uniref:Multidrug efflux MFS transporter n=1 Tax=Clostridium muellerianum TaxID=2716538 RepID=A0A7Y0EEN5_9CLOT|nr:DHA2 family efflux MFS transporter permease subunit [Clostridium muellerianum]NMM61692.1 multidrug efflux MFS transporter [Clostridium muellerianum]